MTDDQRRRGDAGTRFLVSAASVVVVIAGLQAAASLVQPFLIAVFLGVVVVPFMNWLQRNTSWVPAGFPLG